MSDERRHQLSKRQDLDGESDFFHQIRPPNDRRSRSGQGFVEGHPRNQAAEEYEHKGRALLSSESKPDVEYHPKDEQQQQRIEDCPQHAAEGACIAIPHVSDGKQPDSAPVLDELAQHQARHAKPT